MSIDKKMSWEKASIYVLLFTLLGKLSGFFKDILLTSIYGASGITDAFLVSQTIPGTIFQFVGAGLSACFIPIYFRIQNKDGDLKAKEYTNKIFTIICLFSAVVVALTYIFTPQIVKLFAAGFDVPTAKMAESFTRIVIWGLFFSSVIYVLTTYLQAKQSFLIISISATINNAILIIFIWGSRYLGTKCLMSGCLVSLFVQSVLLYRSGKKNGYKLGCNLHLKDPDVKMFICALIPVVFSASVTEINVLIDKSLASVVAGGISALSYANSLIMLAQGIIVQTLTTVAYPNLTLLCSRDKQTDAKKLIQQLTNIVIELMVPLTFGYIIFSQQIVTVAYGRGAFDQSATHMTAEALMCYAVGLCFMAFREVISRCFYAQGDTKTPTFNATIGVCINIVLSICFSYWFGTSGVALATSISAVITSCMLWISYNRKRHDYRISVDIKKIGAVFVATTLAMLPAMWINSVLPFAVPLRFVISCIAAVIVYLLFATLFCFEVVKYGKEMISAKK